MFIVVYDDDMSLCIPQRLAPETPGGLTGWVAGEKIAVFATRKQAAKAIAISKKWAELRKLQGLPVDDTYTTGRRFLRIVPLVAVPD